MTTPQNAMEIFQLLDKSNCRECGEKTCLAFAGAVYRGVRPIRDCPRLPSDVIARYDSASNPVPGIEQNRDDALEALKTAVSRIDLTAAAERTGGYCRNGRLTIKILGKDFSVDADGRLSSEIHVNPWVAGPFLSYVLHGKGRPVTGQWRSFRELRDGRERYPLFARRCETAMKQVADRYTELFDDMVHLFGGRKVPEQFASDISVVLHPLPKVPIMICYWRPDDGIESTLNIFFDASADANLDIGSIFSLGAGLTQMFEKLAARHGY